MHHHRIAIKSKFHNHLNPPNPVRTSSTQELYIKTLFRKPVYEGFKEKDTGI
jgi:hypothetical protein